MSWTVKMVTRSRNSLAGGGAYITGPWMINFKEVVSF